MSSITRNVARIGSFTNSEIVKLTKNGKKAGEYGAPFYDYVEETNMERRMGRTVDVEKDAAAFTWGLMCEEIAFNKLGLEYVLTSDQTFVHPEISYWAGSPDGYKNDPGKTVIDFKACITPKSFCQLVQPLYDGFDGTEAMNMVRDTHKDGDKYYYQLVGNACITGAKYAELIIFMPYKKFLPDIRLAAKNLAGDGPLGKYYWIVNAEDEGLPYLVDDGYYKDVNIIRFEIPEEDKDLLTNRVKAAGKMLIPYQNKADKSKTDILK